MGTGQQHPFHSQNLATPPFAKFTMNVLGFAPVYRDRFRCVVAAGLVILLAGASLPAQQRPDQGALDLSVIDARNNQGLSYAVVRIEQLSIERFTDSRGRIVLGSLSPGEYAVNVRRLGFVPVNRTVTVSAGDPVALTVRLDQVPQTLSKMTVTPALQCLNPGPPDPVRNPEIHTLVALLRENADRYRLLANQYPFSSTRARALGELRDSAVFVQSVEVTDIPGRTRVEYRPGRVVVRRQNRYSMVLPTILDLADDGFAKTHCFFYGGTTTESTEKGTQTWIRLDVRVDDKLKSPDVNGSFYLDSATAQLRLMEIELSRTDRLPPQLSAIGSVRSATRFVEIAHGLSVIQSVCAITTLLPSNKKSEAAERAVVPTELQQYPRYIFTKPPPDVAAQQTFAVEDWAPLTYMSRSKVWCTP